MFVQECTSTNNVFKIMPKFLQHCARPNETTTLETVPFDGNSRSEVSSTGCSVGAGENVALIPIQQISISSSRELAPLTGMIDDSNNRAFCVGEHVRDKKRHKKSGASGSIHRLAKC